MNHSRCRHLAVWRHISFAAAIATGLYFCKRPRTGTTSVAGTTFLVHWWDALPDQWRDELRWERLRRLWWLWTIFGLTGGVALALWLTPQTVGPSTTAATVPSAQQIPQVSPHRQTKTGIDLNQYSWKTCFDYSTNNGVVTVSLKPRSASRYIFPEGALIAFMFIRIVPTCVLSQDLKGVTPGEEVSFGAFDSSSRVYMVPLGGYFIAQNTDGYFLWARILSIKDDTRGEANDEVCFACRINASKSGKFKAF